jgi:CubicO group peptidase (beta-lactamase class C family)
LAEQYVAEGKSIGMVIGVVKNNRTYIKGYGTLTIGTSDVPDSLSVFELASTSKLFTTSTLALMAAGGEVNLDETIQSILSDRLQMPASAQHTTLRHLATHLSGFPSLPDSLIAKMTDEANPYKDLVIQDVYDYLQTCEGKKADGTFEYSNFGMGLLGHLLSLKAGIPYEQLVKQQLLMPLGMQRTSVTVDSIQTQNIVQGYTEQGEPAPIWKDDVLTGAGSFLSNAADMVQFIKANLTETETPLSATLINTHGQQLGGPTGLGWIQPGTIDKWLGNGDMVWHNGIAGGYASFLAIDKTHQYGVIILSNKAVDVTTFGMKMTRTLRTQSWGQ